MSPLLDCILHLQQQIGVVLSIYCSLRWQVIKATDVAIICYAKYCVECLWLMKRKLVSSLHCFNCYLFL